MVFKYLIGNQFKSSIRNKKWRRNILSNIIFGVVILNLVIVFIIIGVNIDKIITGNQEKKIHTFNSFLLWYVAVELLIKCLFMPLPATNITPYLRFRFRRTTIVNYFLFRSFSNLFNLLPWLLVIPFSIIIVRPGYGDLFTACYLVGILLFLLLTNYIAILIGFLGRKSIQYFLIPIGLILCFLFFQKNGNSISNISADFGDLLMHGNIAVMFLLILSIIIVHLFTKKLLLSNFYLDILQSKKFGNTIFQLKGVDKFGNAGEIIRYLTMESALLIRNKRPRQMFVVLPLYYFYFADIIINESNNPNRQLYYLIMLSLIVVYGPLLYGQFIFSWESSYFDGLMARKNNILNYIKAKYYLMVIIAIITFIPLSIIFSIQGNIDFILFFSILLFGIGVVFFIVLFWSTFKNGRIEISENNFFNYNAIRANQVPLVLIAILLPIASFLLFKYFLGDTAGKLALALPGLVFIFFHEWWIKKIIIPNFNLRKYKNLEGSRKLEI